MSIPPPREAPLAVAILADVHGNLVAFDRVIEHIDAWQPDEVIVAGDVINRGPRSIECLERLLDRIDRSGWRVTIGNHEEYVLDWEDPSYAPDDPVHEVFQGARWVYENLTPAQRTAVKAWPFSLSIPSPSGGHLTATHASLKGTTEGIFPWVHRRELRQLIDGTAEVFAVAHTHFPLELRVDETLVVNVGSVGLPFDGDPRTGYVQLTHDGESWKSELVRLEYDRDAADRDFETTGYLEHGGPLAVLVREELRQAESRLFQWVERYFRRVTARELTVVESVKRFLEEEA